MRFYGEERLKQMFAMRDFLDAGIKAAPGSDYTASPAEPMLWLRSEVTRTDAAGHTWGANQRITVEEAIRCSTIHGAYASFEEGIKGSLEPGKLADRQSGPDFFGLYVRRRHPTIDDPQPAA